MIKVNRTWLNGIIEEAAWTAEQNRKENELMKNAYEGHKSTADVMMEIEEGNEANPRGWKGLPPVTDWADVDFEEKVWNGLGWVCGVTIMLCLIGSVFLGLAYPYIH